MTACFRFTGLKWLNRIAVPLLSIVLAYCLVYNLASGNGEALVLATWTTNVSNAYSGGLSLSVLLGQDEKKSQFTTAVAGMIGTVLAAIGILNSIQGFLSLLSAIVPAMMGVMIADYWIIEKGNVDNFEIREGFYGPGVISFLVGAFVACVTGGAFATIPGLSALNFPFFIGPINGIVVSLVMYIVIEKVVNKR